MPCFKRYECAESYGYSTFFEKLDTFCIGSFALTLVLKLELGKILGIDSESLCFGFAGLKQMSQKIAVAFQRTTSNKNGFEFLLANSRGTNKDFKVLHDTFLEKHPSAPEKTKTPTTPIH